MKTVFGIFSVLALVGSAAPLRAQGSAIPAGSVSQPTLGFVVDGAHHLRPMIGVAGAASIGSALDVGMDVSQAAVPPAHDYILATGSPGSWPMMLQVRGGAITMQPNAFVIGQDQTGCDGSNDDDQAGPRRSSRPVCSPTATVDPGAAIDQVALSPSGSGAAFYSSSAGRIYSFANVNQVPTLSGQFNVGALGTLSVFAVSDDGKTAVAGTSDGQTGALFVLATGRVRLVASMTHPAAIAFLHNSSDAVIADDATNTIYSLTDGQVFPIASAQDGFAQPNSIGVSNDNQRVFVGSSQSGSIMTIGPNGTISQALVCNCSLTGLFPTNTDSVFRLTDFSGGPVVLFDANRATPRITFVPLRGSQF